MHELKLDAETDARLERFCAKSHHSKNYYIRKALNDFLDDEEDYQTVVDALKRNESTISWEALREQLDLED